MDRKQQPLSHGRAILISRVEVGGRVQRAVGGEGGELAEPT